MIEYEFLNMIDLILAIKNSKVDVISHNDPYSFKIGYKSINTDEIWTIRLSRLRNIKTKKMRYICC